MIQRIQSIYLFFVFILTALLFFFPLAEFIIPGGIDSYIFKFGGIIQSSDNNPLTYASTFEIGVLIAVISLISLITIFLYKKRTLQIRLCIYNTILMFALIVMIAIYSYMAIRDLDAKFVFNFASSFILISMILSILAFRKIRRDEQLIRGLDRIR